MGMTPKGRALIRLAAKPLASPRDSSAAFGLFHCKALVYVTALFV